MGRRNCIITPLLDKQSIGKSGDIEGLIDLRKALKKLVSTAHASLFYCLVFYSSVSSDPEHSTDISETNEYRIHGTCVRKHDSPKIAHRTMGRVAWSRYINCIKQTLIRRERNEVARLYRNCSTRYTRDAGERIYKREIFLIRHKEKWSVFELFHVRALQVSSERVSDNLLSQV